ncbi:MAG: chemotaxis protein CheW [Sphingomonas sp.]
MTGEGRNPALLFRVRTRLCALPIAHILETMRPLPVESVAAAPDFVLGVALIRGVPTPVVDAGALIGAPEPADFHRFVTLRSGESCVALAVEEVLGVRDLPSTSLKKLPPLLREASVEVLSALGSLDAELLTMLKLARTLTDRVAAGLAEQAA